MPLSSLATGRWFRVPGHRQSLQRYDEAAPHDGTAHWYYDERSGVWRVYRTSDVKEVGSK